MQTNDTSPDAYGHDDYDDEAYFAEDTIAWDEIYERARGAARCTGYAQIIVESGHARYRLIDIRQSHKLRTRRLRCHKIHVIT